jgi:ribonuclease BN (tRNA processing enzyme)
MQFHVVGCSGSQIPDVHLSCFLVNDRILMDAGSATANLPLVQQARVTDILLTHAHLDHAQGILFLADNLIELVAREDREPVHVRGLSDVLLSVRKNLLNNTVWPDFTVIPHQSPVLGFEPMVHGRVVSLDGLDVMAYPVNHATSAGGFVVRDRETGTAMAYTGDLGVSDDWWAFLNGLDFPIEHLVVESSFPSELEELAHLSRHLTPKLLRRELAKLNAKPTVYVTHMKATFVGKIISELRDELMGYRYHILRQGEVLHF